MSRIGRMPVPLPKGVTVQVKDGAVTVAGPKGTLTTKVHQSMVVTLEDGQVLVARNGESGPDKALHGLTRTIIANMVEGVTKGFHKTLTILGMGYRVAKQGNALQIQIGFSHPVVVNPVPGIEFDVEGNNKIHVRGIDKQLVGQVAANIREIRPPEVYKGKGIRYEGEVVKLKLGKAGKVAKK